LECTKFVFRQASAPDTAGGAYSAPPGPLAGLRSPVSKKNGRDKQKMVRGKGGDKAK